MQMPFISVTVLARSLLGRAAVAADIWARMDGKRGELHWLISIGIDMAAAIFAADGSIVKIGRPMIC
jgi:hypothetical protein